METMEIPQEIVNDIFSQLPAKSILRFKSCSKTIYRLTKDNNFVIKHAQNLTLQGGDTSFFIQGHEIKIYPLHGNTASKSSSSAIIPRSFLRFLNRKLEEILLSSNGLLLCRFVQKRGLLDNDEFIICNPTTKSFTSIAATDSLLWNKPQAFLSMDFDQKQNRYELVLLEYNRHQGLDTVKCKTYLSEEGVWTKREKGLHIGYSWMILCPYFKGKYHYLLSYNFENGETRRVLFPKEVTKTLAELDYDDLCTFRWDKVGTSGNEIYLGILDRRGHIFTFWVLKDYRSSSWLMFSTLSFQDIGLEEVSIYGFTVMNGHSLVFAT
ncbi:hypothetical protein QN277_011744 [Acacia crassicarpa]|uniref:F-box domain-containing protein n=2 Tax=Acacia crassicarpa TaxID=499986 RepID=A0AAE1MZ46_9FABA|nr:hypothetical protein QN277_011744 [Acacia crassicarpa]